MRNRPMRARLVQAAGLAALLQLPALAAPVLAAPALAEPAAAVAAVTVAVRTGDHPGFGRVVVDLGRGMKHGVARQDERVTVRLEGAAGPAVPSAGARPPRNVTAIASRAGELELTLAPGARLRSYKLGERLILDIADPDPSAPPDTTATPARPPAAKPQAAAAPPACRPL